MLENIKIVLVQTFHPGNIGAVARAMKNMGLSQLVLVNPVDFPSQEAVSRAGNATDILAQARVVDTLEEALEDCTLIVATSARSRSTPLPMLTPESTASELLAESTQSQVALVFGRERMGLHNDDLKLCHKHVMIDANPEYPVLNISQAVQILCYEIFKATKNQIPEKSAVPYPANREIETFFKFMESTLKKTGFINKAHPHQAMNHLRAFMRRARPTKGELKLLTGMVVSLLKRSD
jgi:tRNA (cytidine32/uridine32-2'-O)-methyltransferase